MRWLVGLAAILALSLMNTQGAYADSSLQLQPLSYSEALKKGERKRAFVDVTNPSSQPINVQFSVQGFRQVDEKGSLSFFNDEKIKSGVLLDYQEKEIPAKKTLRLFFVVDGTKLPTGDVFAAIFAQTKSIESAMVPSVRIGTLLILTNGTPSARKAEIVSLTTPLLQVSDTIKADVKIKNTAPANTSSGFSPKVDVRLWPFGVDRTVQGPLIFAGNTRTIALDEPSNVFGLYKLSASYGTSSMDRWVILVTGIWRWVVPAILGFIVGGFVVYRVIVRRRRGMRH